jgi:hypothetical protein
MPRVLEVNGFRIVIHTMDHEPAHVHVQRDGADLRVYLEIERAEYAYGKMSRTDERNALKIVAQHRELLLASWIGIHR